jgi:tetratricopeptide (TPR) repeat protein
MYLKEGIEYLKEGDFDRAAEAFNSAIVIDPTNKVAIKGLKAAEARVRDIEQLPPEKDPEEDKRKLVSELFQKAVNAFTAKSYQEAIDTAEKIRQIELKGDTQYLNEAKQIIDRARILQKEEFEPFLIQAKEKYAEGDYNASRDLCEEMAKKDSSYDEAKECVLRAKKQLNRLAKEAYTHGYILESMNRIEEAKQYWNRARNYVRQGDEYYDKVNKKLDYYQ